MPFNDFQKAALEAYADGDFKFVTTFEEAKKASDDPLLLFVLNELESPDDIDDAMERINFAINDLSGVFTALMKVQSEAK